MHHNFNCKISTINLSSLLEGSSSFRAAKISANNMFDPVGYDTYFEYV